MTRTMIAAAALLLGVGAANAATIINFETTPTGSKNDGFSATGAPGVQFFSNNGGNGSLVVNSYGNQSQGKALLVAGDQDGNFLRVNLGGFATFFSLDFGNDDPAYTNAGDLAYLAVFSNNVLVGSNTVVLNRDDIMNQTISYSGAAFDTVTFAYTNAALQPFTGGFGGLIEIVDNIVIEYGALPVPEPGALALFGMGLLGMGLVRRSRLTNA